MSAERAASGQSSVADTGTADLRGQLRGESPGAVVVAIVDADGGKRTHDGQRLDLVRPLHSAAAQGHRAGVGPRQDPGRDGRGRGRAQRGDLDRVHHGERPPVVAIVESDEALDGRQSLRRVAGEVGVDLDRDVEPAQAKARCLDVKASRRGVEAQHGGRDRGVGLRAEGGFHGLDAIVNGQESPHVRAREQERARHRLAPAGVRSSSSSRSMRATRSRRASGVARGDRRYAVPADGARAGLGAERTEIDADRHHARRRPRRRPR